MTYPNETEGLLEHTRQGDEYQRGTTVRLYTHGEGGREDHQSCEQGNEEVDNSYLSGRIMQTRLTRKIAGVCAETCRSKTQREECLSQGLKKHIRTDGNEHEATTITNNSIKSSGINSFEAFSIPLRTPRTIMK